MPRTLDIRGILLTALIGLVIAAGAVLTGVLAWSGLHLERSPAELGLVASLLLAAAVSAYFPIQFGQREIFLTVESVPLMLAAFLLDPVDAGLIALLTAIWGARHLPERPTLVDWVARAYDVASVTLSMTLVAWLAHRLDDSGAVYLLPAVAVCLLFELLNDLFVLGAIEWCDRGSARQFLHSAMVPMGANVALSVIGVLMLSPYRDEPMVSMGLLFGTMVCMYFALWVANSQQLEKKRGEHLRETFSRYVPEALVGQHVDHMERVELGGEQRDISVLFCDIRGFTSWSESREAGEIITELNVLLTALSAAVMDTHGTLDKFTGDGLMAFWGAPFPQEDHAALACEAALEMLRRLDEVNAARLEDGHEPFAIGVGVHTGPAVVGNVGHEKRLDYTAIGDTVNLAARLEGATKDIGSVLLISHETVERLPEQLRGRAMRIGDITVKGRRKPVEAWALQPRRPHFDDLEPPLAA